MSVIVRRSVFALALLLLASPAPAQVPVTPVNGLQGFGIVLVLGDVQDGSSDSVPASARAALYDLKDFLPYRSYRVLDTAWLLASSPTRQAIGGRLQGLDEQSYEVTLDRLPVGASTLQVSFQMLETSPDLGVRQGQGRDADRLAMMQRTMAEMRAQLQQAERQKSENHPDVMALRNRIADLETELEARRKQASYAAGSAILIDTSFTMSLGETVVVGTSRMRGGNRALIVLLTAAARGAKPRE